MIIMGIMLTMVELVNIILALHQRVVNVSISMVSISLKAACMAVDTSSGIITLCNNSLYSLLVSVLEKCLI